MSDFQKLAHAVWQCKYHIIWCPKYQFKILRGALQWSVEEILRQLCDWKKLEILEMSIQEDHVHMVLTFQPL
jgi:putative transposase